MDKVWMVTVVWESLLQSRLRNWNLQETFRISVPDSPRGRSAICALPGYVNCSLFPSSAYGQRIADGPLALAGLCSNCLLDEQSESTGSPQAGRKASA
jgi:hypothetical protein